MKNYSTTERTIDANNAWAINRLGLSDTYESGRSLTLGLNYSNERKDKLEHAGGEKNENRTEDDEIHEKLYLLQCEFPFNPPKCTALSSLLYEIKKFRQDLKNNQMKRS